MFSYASIPIPQSRQPSASVLMFLTALSPPLPSKFTSTASATNTPNSPSRRPLNSSPAISPSPLTPNAETKNSPPPSNHFPPCPPFSGASPHKPSSTPSTSTSPPISASATSPPKAK